VKTLKTFAIWTFFAESVQIAYLYFVIPISKVAVYGTNDDALISSISNGQLTGNPNGYLIFLNPLISYPISWLQQFNSDINLYIYFLTFVVTISFAGVLALIQIKHNISFQNRVISLTLWSLSSVTFISWFSLSPTYTGASIFAAGASACFAFMYLSNDVKSEKSEYLILSLFLILFFISISIRLESLYIIVFFLLIVLIPKYFFSKVYFKNFLIIAFSSLLIVLTNIIGEKIVYNQNEWKDFYETNQLRHKIQLREPERKLESSYSEIGWDEGDYDLFTRFTLIEKDKMNSENLSRALEVTNENQLVVFLRNFSINKIVDNTKLAFAPWTWLVMLFALIVAVNIINVYRKPKIWEYISQLALFATGIPLLFLYLATSYHLPERISVNILGGLALILLTISSQSVVFSAKSKKIFFISQILIAIIGSLFYLQRFQIELKARQDLYLTWRSIGEQQRISLSSLPEEIKVIGSASSIKSDWQNPYANFKSLDDRNNSFILGWHNLSPVWDDGIKRMNFNSTDLYANLLESNVYWATNKDDFMIIKKYLAIKTGQEISIKDLGPIGYDQYHYYQLSESTPTN
jgi:hypothetical protein